MADDDPQVKEALSAGEIFEEWGEAAAIAESHVIVPKKGKLFESDGSMRISIIRPCVSRGRRLGGLPPIYTPTMLAESAAIFTDWPMYQDHLAEQAFEECREALEEAEMGEVLQYLQEARRIKELGGRVVKSSYNPDITFKDDADFGFQKGGVEGKVIPQPGIKSMLEADPGLLHVSINAWPTGAKRGAAPWDSSKKGMIIEGLRKVPRGSVDWVFRGGAGGRPLLAEGDLAVTILAEMYRAEHEGTGPLAEDKMKLEDLKKLKPDQLREYLEENDLKHLLPALTEEEAEPAKPKSKVREENGDGDAGVSEERLAEILDEKLAEQAQEFETKLSEHEDGFEDKVQEEVEARELSRTLSQSAFDKIAEAERNGFPRAMGNELRKRYTLYPSGPAAGLQVAEADLKVTEEEDDGTKKTRELNEEQVVERRVTADIEHAVDVLLESGARPKISGLGRSKPDPGGSPKAGRRAQRPQGAFVEFLRESGDIDPNAKDGDKPVTEEDQLRGFVREGAER